MISPLAHVDPDAKIGKNVTIHPFSFISKNVEIGDDCIIYPFVSILNGTRIGNRCKIYNGDIIGAEPQDLRWKGEKSYVIIGDDCRVREHTIINRGIYDGSATRIGNNVFIMAESHIMHDAQISDHVILGNGSNVSYDSKVGPCVILGSSVMLHPGSEIGEWAMVKSGCRVNGNVPPFVIMAHNPITYYGVNAYIMRHKGFSEEAIDDVAKAYRHVYQCNTSVFNAIRRIESDVKPSAERDKITNFIKEHNLRIVAVPSHEDVLD